MKFSTRFVVILFSILFILAVFLYSLNDLTKKQQEEEESRSEMFNSFNTDTYNLRDKHDQALLSDCPNLLVDKGDILLLYNTTAVAENQLVKTFKNMHEYQQYVSEQQSAGKQCPLLYLRQEVTTQGQEVYRMYTEATMSPSMGPNTTGLTNGGGSGMIHVPSPEPAPTVGTTTISLVSLESQNFGQQGRPPMPPPFLESVPIWDLHHQPPLYVEGGLPALPMERRPPGVIEARDAVTDTNPRFNQTGLNSYDPYGLYVGRFTDVDVLHKKTADVSQGLSANAADPNWGGVMYTQQLVRDHEYGGSEVQRAIYPQMGFV
jgi:hypothetical protein